MREQKQKAIKEESNRVGMLADMLGENINIYLTGNGWAGGEYAKNHNASQTAILNQITTLRNELLVLAETIKQ